MLQQPLTNVTRNSPLHAVRGTIPRQMPPTITDDELRGLGAMRYDLLLPESNILSTIIKPDEHLQGIVFGRYSHEHSGGRTVVGRGALAVTDQRIIMIDKKPMYVSCEELAFNIISGVTYSRVFFVSNVVLHTRMGDIHIRTLNQRCAYTFVNAVENILAKQNLVGAWR